MKKQFFSVICGGLLVCGLISGCATQKNDIASTPGAFDKGLAEADAASKAGDQDRAIGLYQKLAAADPTREEPWSRIAQIQFQQQHYGQAIVAAQEALQRDQSDRGAKSVLAVAGLRIATASLGQLRQDASLAGDAKSDAQALAQQLRDTLGEDALFPPEQQPQAAKAPPKRRHIVKHVPAVAQKPADAAGSGAVTTPVATPVATPAVSAAAKSASGGQAADPFSALR
ncbi:tetratricopeptide repeat protein [Paraburkholderia sp. ZP32-5]|uniref:tetratricopeptide repeat protein n=1 Tax=Paraburkholderia sp. ZP32-5 TaxID=2883245 RepID=UPI001F2564B1|nr:hypothetical protein [Paraburkholderia sp. ZP32-5]